MRLTGAVVSLPAAVLRGHVPLTDALRPAVTRLVQHGQPGGKHSVSDDIKRIRRRAKELAARAEERHARRDREVRRLLAEVDRSLDETEVIIERRIRRWRR